DRVPAVPGGGLGGVQRRRASQGDRHPHRGDRGRPAARPGPGRGAATAFLVALGVLDQRTRRLRGPGRRRGAVARIAQPRRAAAPPLDVPGVLLSAGAVACLVWGVIDGPEHGWTAPSVWALLTGSAVLVAAFLGREHRAAHPLIDRKLFADRRFTWGTAATVAVSVALFGIMFVVPQYLQSVAGDDPISAGLRLLPMVGGLLVAGGAASPAARAAGTRLTVAAGLALLTARLTVLSQ